MSRMLVKTKHKLLWVRYSEYLSNGEGHLRKECEIMLYANPQRYKNGD